MSTVSSKYPWGKLDRRSPDITQARRLSLVAHCIDVAAVARALMCLPTWRARLERLAGRALDELAIDRLTVLAFLHDAGKVSAAFQAQSLGAERYREWARRVGLADADRGHTKVVAPLVGHDPRFAPHRAALGLTALRAWDGGTGAYLELWLAAVSHHGEPLGLAGLQGVAGAWRTWTAEVDGYTPLDGLGQLGTSARLLWPAAFDLAAPPQGPYPPAFVHAFAGLVSLADWIGSNDDASAFCYEHAAQDLSRWPAAQHRAAEVLRRMCIDVDDLRADLKQRQPTFNQLFGFSPSLVQEATALTTWTNPVVLEAETGSGKTEAALWRFKALFENGDVDALCFLLPTRVAATAIAARIDGFICKLFPDAARRPNTVLAVPSYLRANGQDGERLPGFEVLWPDSTEPLMYWAAENSKRYFAATAAAGTVDQFLLSTLQTKHSHLRGTALLRALVVVDEVHASDRFMRVLLGHALRRHVAAGGHALLLSATLTSDLRDELLNVPRARPRLRSAASQPPAPPAPSAPSTPLSDYPRISAPLQAPWIGPMDKQKRIDVRLQPWMRDPQAVARCAAEALLAGARVLVLRNTVRQAVATQQALEELLGLDHPALFRCQGVVALHHGRYALPDRQALDRAVTEQFGKNAASCSQPLVLCATQTIEISVDCDADLMITDLAPMDVLLQRLGRLHRHRARDPHRPDAHQQAQAIVLTPGSLDLAPLLAQGATRGLGIGPRSAYPDLLCLQATLNALTDPRLQPLVIPEHNRELVERSCSVAALQALANAGGPAWLTHLADVAGLGSAQGGQAQLSVVNWFQPWEDAVPGDLKIEARTRLGLDGIDIDLPAAWLRSAFGHDIERITVPAWMLGTSAAESTLAPTAQNLLWAPEGACFSVRDTRFFYGRHGLAVVDNAS